MNWAGNLLKKKECKKTRKNALVQENTHSFKKTCTCSKKKKITCSRKKELAQENTHSTKKASKKLTKKKDYFLSFFLG